MKYIYDITLNFNHKYYDFYEWNREDKVVNIKKIPLYRVSKDDYISVKYNDVIISNKFNKMFLITNTLEVMGVIIKDGRVIKRSSLLINEEDNILDSIENMKITKIEFKKNIYKDRVIVNRNNLEKRRYINNFFKSINKTNDEYLLRYIYYDMYEQDDDIEKIYHTLCKVSDVNRLYDILRKIVK